MYEKTSGRDPGAFSRDFSSKLNGIVSEAPKKITGQQIARALNRNDAYVSRRKNAKQSWTVDDVDVIAGLLGTDGLDLIAAVIQRMAPPDELSSRRGRPSPGKPPAYSMDDADEAAARDEDREKDRLE